MLYTFLVTLHVIVGIFLILIILMQKTKEGGGLGGLVGGYSQTLFGTQKGNVLTKTTTILAIYFILSSFLLTFIRYEPKSVVREYDPSKFQTTPIADPGQLPLEQQESVISPEMETEEESVILEEEAPEIIESEGEEQEISEEE